MSRKTMENILDFWIATEFFKPFSVPLRNSNNEDAFFNVHNLNLAKYLYKNLDDVRRNPYKQVFLIYDDWDNIYNNQIKDLKNYAKEKYSHLISESYHYELKDDDIQLIVGEISYQSLLEAASEVELLEDLHVVEPLFALCYHLDDYNNYVMTNFSFKINTIIWYLYCKLAEKDIRDYRKFMCEIEDEINRKKLNYLNSSHLLAEYILNNYIYPVLKPFNLTALNYDKQLILCFINDEFRESKHYIENFTYLDSSFYIRDLEGIKNDIETIDKKSILYQYIMGITNKKHHKSRVDVRTNNKRIIEMLDIDKMPYASWPKDYDLYLLQQFAVNAFVSNKSNNLIAVNGPAGTGKTTLLKDVFAQIIYEKAIFIGQHKDKIFLKKKFDSEILYQDCFTSKKYDYYYKTHPKLNNFSIIVASSNNGAVQNITQELPVDSNVTNAFEEFTSKRIFDFSKIKVNKKELGVKYSEYIDHGYYSFLPSLLLDDASNKDNKNNNDYWGLISAAMGNRENIRMFNSTLIYQGLFGYLNNNEITKENPDKIYSELLENVSKINNVVKSDTVCNVQKIYDDFDGIKRKTQLDRKSLQKRNPYQHILLKSLREKSFVLALDYIKSLVLTSPEVRHNLHLWKNYFEDDVYYRLNEQVVYGFDESDKSEIYSSLLNTVFLIVPILSTTFASVGSMLKYIPRSSLGYLIIDEAGQAVPQSAVGALYRHQKAMIVGDPKQVPPVILTAEDMLKTKLPLSVNNVFKDNPNNRLSVQVLADHACKYGTYYGSKWMGSPLLIHRRCPSPIFDMFNELSYESSLYNETNSSDFIDQNENIFVDIKGKSKGNKNHYVHEHLVYMNQHIDEILMNDSTIQLKDIFVITPFTTVKDGIIKNVKLESVQEDLISSWKKTNVGTVHTFQGKEAKIVFLILGCDDSSDSKGAISWVTENIFNVALSRAKERMIIISDPEAWKINRSYRHIRKTFMNMKPVN